MLRVVSYNVRDLLEDRDALVRVVRALDPDVLALQEAPRRLGARRRLRRLAADCRLTLVCGGPDSGGTALMASGRVRVRQADAAQLPVERWWTRRRGYAAATLEQAGGPLLTVVSIHLPLSQQQRLDHGARVAARLRELADPPYLVAGDLNEPPDGPSWTAFAQVVRDAAAALGADDPTYPARAPRRRIDGVLVSDGLRLDSVRVPASQDGVDPADLVAASDHLPLVADVRGAS